MKNVRTNGLTIPRGSQNCWSESVKDKDGWTARYLKLRFRGVTAVGNDSFKV